MAWLQLRRNRLQYPQDVKAYANILQRHYARLAKIMYDDSVDLATRMPRRSLLAFFDVLEHVISAHDEVDRFWKVYQNEWTGGYTEVMAHGWPEGSYGEEANSPAPQHEALSTGQFVPHKGAGKDLPLHEHALRVNRLITTYRAGTESQRRAGMTWYRNAHRAAVTVASGRDPGVIPYGKKDTPSIKKGVYRPPGVTQEDVTRAAGVIARLSPSMPAGMDWEHNPRAAHELYRMTPKQRAAASEVSPRGSAARRVRGNVALQHSGGSHIKHATSILEGHETAEENLNMGEVSKRTGDRIDVRRKAGSFMRNIAKPWSSKEVTVDARSAGIAAHHRVGFSEVAQDLGNLTGQRYRDYEGAHQEAAEIESKSTGKKILGHQFQAGTWQIDKEGQEYGQGNKTHSGGRAAFRTPFGQEHTG